MRARGTAIGVLVVVLWAHLACRIVALNDARVSAVTQAVPAINRTGNRVRERRAGRASCTSVGVLVVVSPANCARGILVLSTVLSDLYVSRVSRITFTVASFGTSRRRVGVEGTYATCGR